MLHIAKKEEKAKTQQLCSKELSDGWMAGLTGNESLDRQLMRNLNLDQDLGWGLVATDGFCMRIDIGYSRMVGSAYCRIVGAGRGVWQWYHSDRGSDCVSTNWNIKEGMGQLAAQNNWMPMQNKVKKNNVLYAIIS